MDNAYLVLEDGSVFTGESYGKQGKTFGELVFATGMTGYQETLTDPSYAGQIVLQTAPHIGIVGTNARDDESSRIWVAGYVVKEPSRIASNFRSEKDLGSAVLRQMRRPRHECKHGSGHRRYRQSFAAKTHYRFRLPSV